MLQSQILDIVAKYGDAGVFAGMFLESSFFPIPSEAVIIGSGAVGVPIKSIVIFGSLGATLGSLCGYFIGKYAAYGVIHKFGKFIFLKPHHLAKAEVFAKKYGAWGVLIGRVLPIIPFKVFSIASGITGIPVVPFAVFTLIGVIPRIILLSIFGTSLVKYTMPSLAVLAVCGIAFVIYKIIKKSRSSKEVESEKKIVSSL